VIKMVLALQHGTLPPTLHAGEPSPHVDWSAGQVRLLTEPVSWPQTGQPRRAGVSSFGISGTNAHVILEQAPPAADGAAAGQAPALTTDLIPWPVSGRTGEARAAQAERLRDFVLLRPELDPADVGWSLATTRSAFSHRAVVLGSGRQELAAGLAAVATGQPAAGVITGAVRAGRKVRTGFLFAGQGSQRAGMGAQLHAASPVFAAAFDQACALLEAELGVPVAEVVLGSGEDERADQTLYAQAGLFAVEAGLVALLAACGVRPDAVAGHSVGEVTAAYAAGVLSLEDACRLVAARARLMQALPGGGAMTAIAAGEAEVTEALEGVAGVSVAAVNGPQAVVISGDAEAVEQVAESFRERGVRNRRLRVSHAFHSHRMDPVLGELAGVAGGLAYAAPRVPWAGALTGELVSEPGAGYWARQAREPVRFADAVAALAAQEISVFVEIGPDGTLSAMGPAAVGDEAGPVFIPVLRSGQPGPAAVLDALARAHVQGVGVDWTATVAGRRTDLPTYAFQHQRYWPEPAAAPVGDVTAAGLGAVGHPLLGAAAALAGDEGYLLTGRLSVRSHPWLADHALAGTILLPGAAFVEMAFVAADAAGCERIEELTLEEPLALPADPNDRAGGTVRVQVMVGGPGPDGRRTVEVHSQPADSAGAGPWTRHARGLLAPGTPADPGTTAGFEEWPPPGAVAVDAGRLYGDLAADGYGYGPAFRCVRAAWRRGQEVFAEVALPEGAGARSFGLHPALLDACLHAAGTTGPSGAEPGQLRLATDWAGVSLHATGATVMRVWLRPGDDDSRTLVAADPAGAAVLTVASVASRPVAVPQPYPAGGGPRGTLFTVDWVPLPARAVALTGHWAVAGADRLRLAAQLAYAGVQVRPYADLAALADAVAAGDPVPDGVLAGAGALAGDVSPAPGDAAGLARDAACRVLALVQQWLGEDRLSSSRLVLLTRGAVAAVPGEGVTDLAGAAVWGLVRSAQSEDPGRIALVDLPAAGPDGELDVLGVLAAAAGAGEAEVAIRGGLAYGRRLARPAGEQAAPAADLVPAGPARPAGTVLVTGGTGMLGGLLAGHLADAGRARSVVLASRSGPGAPGAARLAAAVAGRGAGVQVTVCDTADRAELAGLLAAVPDTAPLTMVVHTAGVVDDGVIGSLTPDRVDAVMRPKADAAWYLHELTTGLDLEAFVLFSSAAATFGGSGQGNYAAGNAFLDGLAAHRQAAGLPATSLAWGLWDGASAISGHLSDSDRARIARSGMGSLTAADGLALFDVALAAGPALMVPLQLELGGHSDPEHMPALLRGLVQPRTRRAADTAAADTAVPALRERLAGAPEAEQSAVVLDLVSAHVAAVLGYGSPGAIEARQEFHELGFDSLTAIELRNQLNAATGLRLSATLVFDYPTPAGLAEHLLRLLTRDGVPAGTAAIEEISKLEKIVANIAADDDARAGLTIRMRALLAALEGTPQAAAGGDDDLAAATAENIFELLDQELGES
jgi:acyl transferase domain-containing protein/acyl carrier protein